MRPAWSTELPFHIHTVQESNGWLVEAGTERYAVLASTTGQVALTRAWRDPSYQRDVVVTAGDVAIQTDGDALLGFDLRSALPRWRTAIPALGLSERRSVVVSDGVVVVRGRDEVLGFDAASGRTLWRVEAPLVGDLAVDDGRVYFSASESSVGDFGAHRFLALDAQRGQLLWSLVRATAEEPDGEAILVGGGRVVRLLTTAASVAILDGATGRPRATATLPESGWGIGSIRGRHLLVAVGPSLTLVDLAEGRTLWTQDVGDARGYQLGEDGAYYQTPYGSLLQALDRQTGEERWQQDVHYSDAWMLGNAPNGRGALAAVTSTRDCYGNVLVAGLVPVAALPIEHATIEGIVFGTDASVTARLGTLSVWVGDARARVAANGHFTATRSVRGSFVVRVDGRGPSGEIWSSTSEVWLDGRSGPYEVFVVARGGFSMPMVLVD